MDRIRRVAAPPAKPLLLYDGDSGFCRWWRYRCQHATGDLVEYLPFQDARVATQFPEIPREQLESAVQLILPDRLVFSAAEAVFRSLACKPVGHWLLDRYQDSAIFARISERSYGFVAHHRQFFSWLTRTLGGSPLEPPQQNLVRWVFLRALGVIYLIAFISLGTQVTGLVGSNGIVPAQLTMQSAKQQFDAQKIGLDRYHQVPTLCWFSASDRFLKLQCAAGVGLAILLVLGLAPAPVLFLLWLLYLSLSTVGGVFLSFQWDALLLETGFLAIFFAPLQWLPRGASHEAPPSRIVLWLLRILLFRLIFESGCVKLLNGDPTWRSLNALAFHYESQPLPTWVSWYAHQLPAWFQKISLVAMFAVELVVPFFIFLPRKPRQLACAALIALQLVILITGNYCFFNLLTILLCLPLLDDAALRNLFRAKLPILAIPNCRQRRWPLPFTLSLTAVIFSATYTHFFRLAGVRVPGPPPVTAIYRWLQPFRTFNSYGLFAVMTTSRPEIIIEGSNDGVEWKDYKFKYKAGDLKRRPHFVEPHQPRLDWQFWFAALGDLRQNLWLVNFGIRLLQGSPEVLALLEKNPFPNSPPRYIRALVWDYHFTDIGTRNRTGEWWRRDLKGTYLPPISLNARAEHPASAP